MHEYDEIKDVTDEEFKRCQNEYDGTVLTVGPYYRIRVHTYRCSTVSHKAGEGDPRYTKCTEYSSAIELLHRINEKEFPIFRQRLEVDVDDLKFLRWVKYILSKLAIKQIEAVICLTHSWSHESAIYIANAIKSHPHASVELLMENASSARVFLKTYENSEGGLISFSGKWSCKPDEEEKNNDLLACISYNAVSAVYIYSRVGDNIDVKVMTDRIIPLLKSKESLFAVALKFHNVDNDIWEACLKGCLANTSLIYFSIYNDGREFELDMREALYNHPLYVTANSKVPALCSSECDYVGYLYNNRRRFMAKCERLIRRYEKSIGISNENSATNSEGQPKNDSRDLKVLLRDVQLFNKQLISACNLFRYSHLSYVAVFYQCNVPLMSIFGTNAYQECMYLLHGARKALDIMWPGSGLYLLCANQGSLTSLPREIRAVIMSYVSIQDIKATAV